MGEGGVRDAANPREQKSLPPAPARLVDYQTSKQRMGLFSRSGTDAHVNPTSCFSPESAITDKWWEDSTPPPYDPRTPQAQAIHTSGASASPSPASQPSGGTSRYGSSYRERRSKSFKARSSIKRHFSKATPRSYSRPFRPGISVDTSVTRHKGNTPRQVFPTPKLPNALGSTPSTPEDGEQQANGWARRMSHKKQTKGRGRGAIAGTMAGGGSLGLSGASLAVNTPLISITPAQASDEWSPPDFGAGEANVSQTRRRPSSSVYSQVTTKSAVPYAWHDTPPLPPLPTAFDLFQSIPPIPSQQQTSTKAANKPSVFTYKRESEHTAFEEDMRHEEHPKSADTLFEEDRAPWSASPVRQQFARNPKDLVIDPALPTPRRSKGWWNFITSPFELNRSATKLFRSPTESHSADHQVDMGRWYPIDEEGAEHPMTHPSPDATPKHIQQQMVGRNHEGEQTKGDSSHIRNASSQSFFSPNDRDVPLVLDGASVSGHGLQPQALRGPDIKVLPPVDIPQHLRDQYQSPSSAQTVTPVLETAALGTIHAAKSIVHSPNPSTQHQSPGQPGTVFQEQASHDSHSVVAAPNQTKYIPHAQYMQKAAHVQRPMTIFPVFETALKKQSLKAPSPVVIANVRSVWEEEDLPKEKREKKRKDKKAARAKKQKKSRRRCMLCCICVGFLIFLAILLALVLTLTRHHHTSTSAKASATTTAAAATVTFVNLTGLPPMPTGQMSIAQPTLLADVDGCVNPSQLWSCEQPKDDQQANEPSQPQFKLSITFNNDSNSASAKLRFRRDLDGSPFEPSPAPPSEQDQVFLGNTTEHLAEPYLGEDTPFFISFLSTTDAGQSNKKVKRSPTKTSSAASSTSQADLATAIPSPSVLDDGTAAPANLLPSPLPSNQPLKLYNRGRSDEHYGFYTYFDRSIFLRSVTVNDGITIDPGQAPADRDGGSTKDGANARCTWTETRFLVQIWTRISAPLLSASTNTSSDANTTDPASAKAGSDSTFPYPITITTDRHGGTPSGKMIYCYALDDQTRPVPQNKTLYQEFRGFDGTLVNPQTLFGEDPIDPREAASKGGIDGGTGGCGCRWGNWQDSNDSV